MINIPDTKIMVQLVESEGPDKLYHAIIAGVHNPEPHKCIASPKHENTVRIGWYSGGSTEAEAVARLKERLYGEGAARCFTPDGIEEPYSITEFTTADQVGTA
jgi:hypothetical protein